jgi:adenylosuccinate lyase
LEDEVIKDLVTVVTKLIDEGSNIPMLSLTHGQPASPTTFGKEMAVFAARFSEEILLSSDVLCVGVKFGGATGNFNAHKVAYPDINWEEFADHFVEKIGTHVESFMLVRNNATTQISSYDSWARVFGSVRRINTILIGLCRDMWTYISRGIIVQQPKKGEVGSSVMPHKINPIDFENAEGNLEFANALLEFFERKLPISRMQRDLTDSTVARNVGMVLAYCYMAYQSLLKGLQKIKINEAKMAEELIQHPEVITEAIQTILRREGDSNAYNKLKDLARRENGITMEELHSFVDSLDIGDSIKDEIKRITPLNYVGYAPEIAQFFLKVDSEEDN